VVLDTLFDVGAAALTEFALLVALAGPALLGARFRLGRPLDRRETLGYLFDVLVTTAALGGAFGVAWLVVTGAFDVGRLPGLAAAALGVLACYLTACWLAYAGTFREGPSPLGRLTRTSTSAGTDGDDRPG
jgi:hypothetical protein